LAARPPGRTQPARALCARAGAGPIFLHTGRATGRATDLLGAAAAPMDGVESAETTSSGDSDSGDGPSPTDQRPRGARDAAAPQWADADAQPSNSFSKARKQQLARELTRDDLVQLFGWSLEDAARHVGLGRTSFKQVCRREGIEVWPQAGSSGVTHIPATRTVPHMSSVVAALAPAPPPAAPQSLGGAGGPEPDLGSSSSQGSPRRRKRSAPTHPQRPRAARPLR
jgi:hypothetical protein